MADRHKTIKVLVEATKMLSDDRDGIHRYVNELLFAMAKQASRDEIQWHIDVFVGRGSFFSIVDVRDLIGQNHETSEPRTTGQKLKRLHSILGFRDRCINQIKSHLSEKWIQRQKSIKNAFDALMFSRHPLLLFKDYDVVHLTQPQSYLHFQNCRRKMVTTVHDLTHLRFPQFHLQDNIDNANRGMRLAIEKNSEFIAVSNATRKDLLSDYPMIGPDQVHVIHEACNPQQFKPSNNRESHTAVRLKYRIPEHPFLLSLSTLEPRKNLLNAVKAFLRLTREKPEICINFVVAGKTGWKHDALSSMAAARTNRLIFTGFVDDGDLAALYSAALAFSYVSFYEGFGLPPLEAMSCGTPVVYGNNSAMVEVVGNGGLAADPNDVEDIKKKYEIMALNTGIRSYTAQMALERSRQFTWETTARKTLDAYKDTVLKT